MNLNRVQPSIFHILYHILSIAILLDWLPLASCENVNDTINFDGQSFIIMDLQKRPIASFNDTIKFRFHTNHANGNILYSRGTQGDTIALQIYQNKLTLSLDLGVDGNIQTVSAGSLLDDNLWHDVQIYRSGHDIIF